MMGFLRSAGRSKGALTIGASMLVLLGLSAVSVGAPQKPEVDLRFSDGFHIVDEKGPAADRFASYYFNLTAPDSAGKPQFPFHAEVGTDYKVTLDPRTPAGTKNPSDRSLQFLITSDHTELKRDKIFLSVVPYDSAWRMLQDDQNTRHVSFDFMLDPHYEVSPTWVIHLQVWQCCGGHPPFTMSVASAPDKNAPIFLTFGLRDDDLEHQDRHPEKVLSKFEVKRGEWHHIDMLLHPQSETMGSKGSLEMTFDGIPKIDYHGAWGYDPNQAPFQGHKFSNAMAVELGVYRQRQTSTQVILFDNITYGAS